MFAVRVWKISSKRLLRMLSQSTNRLTLIPLSPSLRMSLSRTLLSRSSKPWSMKPSYKSLKLRMNSSSVILRSKKGSLRMCSKILIICRLLCQQSKKSISTRASPSKSCPVRWQRSWRKYRPEMISSTKTRSSRPSCISKERWISSLRMHSGQALKNWSSRSPVSRIRIRENYRRSANYGLKPVPKIH